MKGTIARSAVELRSADAPVGTGTLVELSGTEGGIFNVETDNSLEGACASIAESERTKVPTRVEHDIGADVSEA